AGGAPAGVLAATPPSVLLRCGHGPARRAHRLAHGRRRHPDLYRRGLAGVPLGRGHGPLDGCDHRRALHRLLHRRLSRSVSARAHQGRARAGMKYSDAGVDITRADDALARIRDRVRATRRPEVIGDIGAFGGLFRLTGTDTVLVATTDGVGTKLELARLLDRHEGIGADLVHHCVNDALAMGAEPLFFLDYFSTSRLDPEIFSRVVGAMADACRAQGCTLLGGETAEMPGMYAPGSYDLAGFLVGGVARDRVLDPAAVREGDVLIGLPSTGLHTNGYTLASAIVDRRAAREERELRATLEAPRPELRGGSLGDALLATHRCYLEDVRRLRAAAAVRSIAHLTGG